MLSKIPSARTGFLTCATLLACTCLSGCSLDLLAQHKPKKPATELANKPASTTTVAAAMAKTPRTQARYTDPLVSAAATSQKRAATGLMAQNAAPRKELPLTSPPSAAPASMEPAPPGNDMAALVKQPTTVSANTNSLYSLANAQIAASEGVSAYAPVRNINPMAGSVFSAPARQVETTSTPEKPAKADGLW